MKAYAFEKNGIPVMLLKSETDTRDGVDVIKSRVGLEHKCYVFEEGKTVWDYLVQFLSENGCYPKWILVDESQFLSKTQVDMLAHTVDNYDINIICYGLRTDFKGELFEGSKRLFEVADSIEELKLTCQCGNKAIINARVDEYGDITTNGKQVELGGNERYVSVCRKCYNSLKDTHILREQKLKESINKK